MTRIPIEDQVKAIEREIGYRARVYPRLVQSGRMTANDARKQTLTMEAVLETLQEVEKGSRLI